jgi:hypothetical protein
MEKLFRHSINILTKEPTLVRVRTRGVSPLPHKLLQLKKHKNAVSIFVAERLLGRGLQGENMSWRLFGVRGRLER